MGVLAFPAPFAASEARFIGGSVSGAGGAAHIQENSQRGGGVPITAA